MQTSRRTTLKLLMAGSAMAAYGRAAQPVSSASTEPLKIPPLNAGEMKAGVRHFDLRMDRSNSEFFANLKTPTYGINGNYLGPTVKLQNGESVRLNVHNNIGETSTLHWHGLHLPASADGGPHQMIEHGKSWQAAFEVKQHAATFW